MKKGTLSVETILKLNGTYISLFLLVFTLYLANPQANWYWYLYRNAKSIQWRNRGRLELEELLRAPTPLGPQMIFKVHFLHYRDIEKETKKNEIMQVAKGEDRFSYRLIIFLSKYGLEYFSQFSFIFF